MSTLGRVRKRGVWGLWPVAVAPAVVALAVWQAAGTMEWGNRLHRVGAFEAAASAYRGSGDDAASAQLRAYNLGTALLEAGSDEAERHLERAAAGPDRNVAQKAHYNVGYHLVGLAGGSSDQVATVALLLGAIRNNRIALRLDPADEDARWNLAVAQRRFETLANLYEEGQAEQAVGEVDTPPDDGEGMGATTGMGAGTDEDGAPPEDARGEEGGGAGAAEALLGEGDPGPLSERAARLLLEDLIDDPTLVVRGVLWSERPDSD